MMNPEKIQPGKELHDAVLLKLEAVYGENAKKYTSLIDTVKTMKGSDCLFKESLNFDDIRMPDFIVELFLASFFHEENYSVEIIPRSDRKKTPDLLISNRALRGYVEIKHIHKKHDGPKVVFPEELPKMDLLEKYGDSARDERYCRDKFWRDFSKFSNIQD